VLFHRGLFSPELIPDRRSRDVLSAATREGAERIGTQDLLAGAIRGRDARAMETFARALRPGYSLDDLMSAAETHAPTAKANGSAPRKREAFSPEALQALEEFERNAHAVGGAAEDVLLELLVSCVLARLEHAARSTWTMLDVDRAAALFRDRVASAVTGQRGARATSTIGYRPPENGGAALDEPFLLPPELAPSEDLTHRVRTRAITVSPFEGEAKYERVFDAIARALHRRGASHVLLVAERGVGQQTVLAELARLAATGRIPFLSDKRFLMVDCRFVAPEESRERLIAILSHLGGHERLVVCLNGFGGLLRTDRATTNRAVLMSALSRIRCRIVGGLTPRDYDDLISDDPDVSEFFTKVDLEEPSTEVAVKLVKSLATGLEHKYEVAIEEDAVRKAVVLSSNYILNDRLPAKALKILHRVSEDIDYERTQLGSERSNVTADDVVAAVSEQSGVPQETLRGIAERSDYRRSLAEAIVGQDHAVAEVATELGLIKAGLTDPSKPASVMLFVGQTGTGKTEMAKALARFYSTSKRLRTYTLGNFVEPHSVAGIIGVPPGYVGHDQGGRLVNDLNADPYCVFLLDEADKAHPDVLQPFLNLFDEGWIRDQRGVQAYADKSIFVLTTNVGQRMISDMAAKGKTMDEIANRMKDALSQIRHGKSNRPVFPPEFLARIKRIIVFKPLDRDAMKGICDNLLRQMQRDWQEKRGKSLDVPESLVQHIAESAHQQNQKSKGREGGRIVRKLIAELIEANVQRRTSESPDEYRQSDTVAIRFVPPPNSSPTSADVSVGFPSSRGNS